MTDFSGAGAAARANRALDPLHAMIYFAPEADEEFERVGLRRGRMAYFAGRAAPMGRVGAGVVTATFYNFHPSLVAHNIPRAWEQASVKDILAARLTAADRALRRLLGDAVDSAELAELAELARIATHELPAHGRALFAAHAELPWPDAPHLVLWHAITLLREFRGDGHVAALLDGELSGLEALITHCATGYGFTEAAAKATRGWSDDEWAAGVEALRTRGILDSDGLTAGGVALRDAIERATDRLSAAPWSTLGPDRVARAVELGRGFTTQIAANGAWPKGVFAAR
ncbi:hypothetical protein [uncultured Jatrophihabitans sp.]|uniref:SCO6745 family protein n=1 Tax=uncultured Jatrophihabitans sp. TaxID=1610747 RepID=UPI0035CAAA61